MRIVIEVDEKTGIADVVSQQGQYVAVRGEAITFPHYVAEANHTFASQTELDQWVAAVKRRDDALAGEAAQEALNYVGTIDPNSLGLYDWAAYVKSGLWRSGALDYTIFSRKPIVRDPADGRVLMNPEAELAAVDVSGYGGPLAAFLPKEPAAS